MNSTWASEGKIKTYEEMKNFMELKSKSSIFQYLEYLEDLGHIKRDKLKSRSIKLNKMMPFFNEISAGNPLEILNEDVKYINYSDARQDYQYPVFWGRNDNCWW